MRCTSSSPTARSPTRPTSGTSCRPDRARPVRRRPGREQRRLSGHLLRHRLAPPGRHALHRPVLHQHRARLVCRRPGHGTRSRTSASLCAHTVDYNSDGWPDLLVCGEAGGLHLFENDQGHGFTDVSSILGPPVNAVDAAMVDVNHDSRPDLITLTRNRARRAPPERERDIRLAEDHPHARKTEWHCAVGDVNGDNNPDIYVVCGRTGSTNAPDYLLIGNATGGFTTMTIPQTTVGAGDSRLPDRLHPLRPEVLPRPQRRGPHPGPVQLLTPNPS